MTPSPSPPPISLRLGDLTIDLLRDGSFRLDGGAMFGVVPKTLWERRSAADGANRIDLGLNCLLIRGGGRTVLVETGIGEKWSDREREIYAIDRSPGLEAELLRAGVEPDAVDHVLLTHLHFDHAGGNTRRGPDGAAVPAFPRARYIVQAGNLVEEAKDRHELRKASYIPDNFIPVEERGQFDLVRGDAAVLPGISVQVTGGHQLWHQAVRVESGGRTLIFPGDILPTAAHVDPPYIMAYDHYPLQTLASKKALLEEVADTDIALALCHEKDHPLGRIRRDARRYRWEPLAEV